MLNSTAITKQHFLNIINVCIALFSYVVWSQEVTSYIVLALLFCNLLGGYRRGIMLWCSCSYFLYTLNTVAFAIGMGVIVFLLFFKSLGKISGNEVFILICTIAVMALSYHYGKDPQILSALLTLSNILLYLLLILSFRTEVDFKNIVDAFWMGSIIIAGCTLFSIYKEGSGDANRLGFDGNVRELANVLVFPLYLKITDLLERKHSSSIPLSIENVYTTLFIVLLLLTMSKGAIFALFCAIIAYSILAHKINGRFILIVFSVVILFTILINYAGVDFSRLGERNYDLNGRTLIWSFYLEKLVARGDFALLLGFGPGNVNRIAPDEYLGRFYAHSTFLDFLFSYGILGFTQIVTFIFLLYKYTRHAKNYFGQAFLLLVVLTFATHGASTNVQLFIAFYVISLSTFIKRDTDRRLCKNRNCQA